MLHLKRHYSKFPSEELFIHHKGLLFYAPEEIILQVFYAAIMLIVVVHLVRRIK